MMLSWFNLDLISKTLNLSFLRFHEQSGFENHNVGWPARMLGYWFTILEGAQAFCKGGPSSFFLKLTYLKYIYIYINIWTRGAWPPPMSIPALRNQKENKNKTRLITIQQYKSQTAKNPNGKLKNSTEILVMRNGGDFKQKGKERVEN